MVERNSLSKDRREKDPNSIFQVTVIGPACSGKTTLLLAMSDRYTVRPEPNNPIFPFFLENPQKYAYQNQLHKMTQLMEQEIVDTKVGGLSDPHFRESGVLATDIYNRYLFDQGLMTLDQFKHLDWLYEHHMDTFPVPDLVVYLFADDNVIEARALQRDGLIAHDPHALQPYWNRLLESLEKRSVSILRINTGDHMVEETKDIILLEAEKKK